MSKIAVRASVFSVCWFLTFFFVLLSSPVSNHSTVAPVKKNGSEPSKKRPRFEPSARATVGAKEEACSPSTSANPSTEYSFTFGSSSADEWAVLKRMEKQKLQDLCHDHGINFDKNETRAMLIAVLAEWAVLNRMKKQKLQDLCHDYGVDFDENETRAMLITKLTNLS